MVSNAPVVNTGEFLRHGFRSRRRPWSATRRYPLRDRVIILLSVRAGLRAKEISNIRWSMVTDAQGAVTNTIHLVNGASQGQARWPRNPYGQRPRQALVELQAFKPAAPEDRIIFQRTRYRH